MQYVRFLNLNTKKKIWIKFSHDYELIHIIH